ncbi:hypothetical protein DNG97_05800 [Vibrio parahaemolyticus]|nr:hypothetical protein [Vibrio parahaemolyticus]EHK2857961.1 hypothetical protein [Vibrio parahaemolyticus]
METHFYQILATLFATIATVVAMTGEAFQKENKYRITLRGAFSILFLVISTCFAAFHIHLSNEESSQLSGKISTLVNSAEQMKADANNKNNKIESQSNEIRDLKSYTKDLQSEIKGLKSYTEELKIQTEVLKTHTEELKSRVIVLKEELNDGTYFLTNTSSNILINLEIETYVRVMLKFHPDIKDRLGIIDDKYQFISKEPLGEVVYRSSNRLLLIFNANQHIDSLKEQMIAFINEAGGRLSYISQLNLRHYVKITFEDAYGKRYERILFFNVNPLAKSNKFRSEGITPSVFKKVKDTYDKWITENPQKTIGVCEIKAYGNWYIPYMITKAGYASVEETKVNLKKSFLSEEKRREVFGDTKTKYFRTKTIANKLTQTSLFFHNKLNEVDDGGSCKFYCNAPCR